MGLGFGSWRLGVWGLGVMGLGFGSWTLGVGARGWGVGGLGVEGGWGGFDCVMWLGSSMCILPTCES